MKVVIPLAGKGTRLRPHTYETPKPLLRVGGRPVMSYILDDLKELGVQEIVFITGYLREKIEAYIETEYPGFEAHYVEQKVQDGTAGAGHDLLKQGPLPVRRLAGARDEGDGGSYHRYCGRHRDLTRSGGG